MANRSSKVRWGLLAGLTALGAAWAAEAEGAPRPLSLADAQHLALVRNSDLRIAQAQVAAALGQLKSVREFPNPTLGLSTADLNTDGKTNATPLGNSLLNRSYDSIASLSQLFLIAKRGVMRDAADAGVHVAEFQRDDERRLLLQSVTLAYLAALDAREQVRVLQASAAALRREAEIAAIRLHAGDVSASDQAQIEIAAEQDELNAEAQEATAKTAVVTLEILLGDPQPAGLTPLTDTLGQLQEAAGPDLENLPMGKRPDIAAAEQAVSQAESQLTLQKRQRVPDVTVSVQYERQPPDAPNTVGIGLSLPLPLWNRNAGGILSAQAARNQAEEQLDKVRIQAAADVTSARVAYHEAAARMRRYLDSLLPKSASVVRSVSYAYQKGGASLVDLLEAERNDNLVRVGAAQAQADAASAAVNLRTALGGLEEGSLSAVPSPP